MQGRVPTLVVRTVRPADGVLKRLPAVIFCHDAGRSKEEMLPQMEACARRGYIAIAADARYHGARFENPGAMRNALAKAAAAQRGKSGAEAGPAVYV